MLPSFPHRGIVNGRCYDFDYSDESDEGDEIEVVFAEDVQEEERGAVLLAVAEAIGVQIEVGIGWFDGRTAKFIVAPVSRHR